jgi:hypothetical protein
MDERKFRNESSCSQISASIIVPVSLQRASGASGRERRERTATRRGRGRTGGQSPDLGPDRLAFELVPLACLALGCYPGQRNPRTDMQGRTAGYWRNCFLGGVIALNLLIFLKAPASMGGWPPYLIWIAMVLAVGWVMLLSIYRLRQLRLAHSAQQTEPAAAEARENRSQRRARRKKERARPR